MIANVEAEMACLGAMLLSPKAVRDVVGIVGGEDFSREVHRSLFAAILEVSEHGDSGAVSVAEHMRRAGTLPAAGPMFIRDIEASVTTTASARHHAEIVRDVALLRRIKTAGEAIAEMAVSNGHAPTEIAERATQTLSDAASGTSRGDVGDMEWVQTEAANDLEMSAQSPRTVPTRIPRLDRMLDGGLHGGRFYVLGSRPSVGKSAFATNIVRHALDDARGVLFCSLEMTGSEVLGRLLSDKFRFDSRDKAELARRMFEVSDWPLMFMSQATVTTLSARARELRPDLIVIDYVQLLPSVGKYERRDLEVAAYTRTLKMLAVELRTPILALSQVNRAPTGRSDSRPRMSDLRESGALEADPDGVFLLDRDTDKESREALLSVQKNRHGPTGVISLVFDAVYTRFREMERP